MASSSGVGFIGVPLPRELYVLVESQELQEVSERWIAYFSSRFPCWRTSCIPVFSSRDPWEFSGSLTGVRRTMLKGQESWSVLRSFAWQELYNLSATSGAVTRSRGLMRAEAASSTKDLFVSLELFPVLHVCSTTATDGPINGHVSFHWGDAF